MGYSEFQIEAKFDGGANEEEIVNVIRFNIDMLNYWMWRKQTR